jgi:single-strand DNA-binding protein
MNILNKHNMSELTKTGELIAIDDIITFDSGFQKREFVIKTTDDGDYPQDIKFELVKDKCDYTDKYTKGDEITVHFNMRGNEYKGKYYVNLVAWRLEGNSTGTNTKRPAAQQEAQAVVPAATIEKSEEMDDIPF